MKLTTFITNNETHLGLIVEEQVIDLSPFLPNQSSLRSVLENKADLAVVAKAALNSDTERTPLSKATLAPLVPEPGKFICLGLNYFDHAKEGGREKPDYPWFFYRGKSSLMGDKANGVLPKISHKLDFEAELAVIIGSTVPRHTKEADALQYVFGYSCFNDISVRDYQKRTPQWTIGKNFDSTGAFGPVLVTADELPQGAKGLSICSRLNGQVMQNANTSDMIWSVAETIALLSEVMTLEAGDVIAMGTPAGVGQARDPQVWMKAGDMIEVEIEGIGTLTTPIVAEEA